MYVIKEAGIIALIQILGKLAPYGYKPLKYTTILWHHTSHKTMFVIFIDDFGVNYFSRDDSLHLIKVVKNHY